MKINSDFYDNLYYCHRFSMFSTKKSTIKPEIHENGKTHVLPNISKHPGDARFGPPTLEFLKISSNVENVAKF